MRWREAVPLAVAAAAVAAAPAAAWAPASEASVVRAAPAVPVPPPAADTSARAPASPCAASCCGGDVRALLARAEARYDSLRSLQASFEQVVEVPLLDQKREGHGTWYQEGRARFRMDFSEPPHDLIVADGTHLWLYYPSTNPGQVVRTSLEGDPTGTAMVDLEGRIFRQARTGFDATLAGREKVAGVATCRIDLVAQPGAETTYRKVRVWVGAGDFLVRRFEITEENETVRTVTLSDLRPDAAIPDSLFTFHVPTGVDVFSG